MPTAYIYVRVSTDKQDLSPEWQEQVCRRYVETTLVARGFTIGEVFADLGQSAYNIPWAERDQGRLLFQAVKPGDTIVAAKQDRVWRSVRDRENSLFFLNQMGIGLAILDAQFDTSTASGKFAAGVIALQSAWESDVRSERAKAAASIRFRRKLPRKKFPPAGWQYDRNNEEMVPDMQERRLLEMVYRWRETKVRSVKATCRWLREEGVKRANGTFYDQAWVFRSYMNYKRGWPQEGYSERFWKDKNTTEEEKARYRMPQSEGTRTKSTRLQSASAADLRWLASTYQADIAKVSQPDEQKSPQSGQTA